jgi:lipopolysaccharide/colanic/teichoic acid biosynthesis glycosyltransferase
VYETLKRILDVTGAFVVLSLTIPLLALAALVVRLTMGAPVVYRQTRSGRGGRSFTLLKLRTMRLPTDANGSLVLSDDSRLTAAGRWLRATSLDELPQLWNVLRGDMSLVGPRPLLPEYLSRYSPEQARRHEVLPGITGLAQVSGRNALSWEEKFRLDVWYVDHRSLTLDLWIMCRTLLSLMRRDSIAAPGHATMPEFRGDRETRAGRTCATS